MTEFFIWLFKGLIPPIESSGNQVYRWRVALAVIVMSNSLAITGLAILAFGVVPPAFHGFAHATDLDVLNATVMDLRHGQLDDKILATRKSQCDDIKTNNQDALLFATQRLQSQLETWNSVTGGKTPYRLPGCEEL